MNKKIAVIGPECSGKSTLAQEIGNYYNATVIDEYAREYLQEIRGSYKRSDLEKIAKSQFQKNNLKCENLLVADTEMLVIKIWFEEKYNSQSSLIDDLLQKQHFDHYLLCKPDIPWEYDELRENPIDRGRIYLIYKNLVQELYPESFTIIEGGRLARFEKAIKIISDLI
jgi:nicotinamide riboside kinase